MEVVRLTSVDGWIVLDLDSSPVNAGGTRFAPDVTLEETALLARAMTYKFAILGRQTGGAKGGVRGPYEDRDVIMRRYCEEISSLVKDARFLTGPDLGTSERDFAPLRTTTDAHVMASSVGEVAMEDLVAGFGVVAAAEAAAGPLEGLTMSIEGFGKVGGGVAREAVRRGASVVAVSTLEGTVHIPHGLDVELLLQLRRAHGDGFVWHLGVQTLPVDALWDLPVDVVVPGARTGTVTEAVAERLRARWVVPAANAPYAAGVPELLHRRGVRALADFVCNVGAVIGYIQPPDTSPGEVFRFVERDIGRIVTETSIHPGGHYEGACAFAERFLHTWRGPDGMPDGRPLAGAVPS